MVKKEIIVFLFLLGFFAGDSFADRLKETSQMRAKALSSYYEELKKLGPGATDEQKKQLYDRVVRPAGVEYGNAVSEVFGKAIKAFEPGRKQGVAEVQSDPTNAAEAETRTPLVFSPIDVSQPDEKEPVGLDGSEVPRELEFPGTLPSPSPSIPGISKKPGLNRK